MLHPSRVDQPEIQTELKNHSWGESNSPYFCEQQAVHVIIFLGLIVAPLPSLSIYFYLQCSKGCLDIDVERKEEKNDTKKESIAWTAVQRNCEIWNY